MIDKPVKSLGCPLGATCQREDDEFIYRCPWYIKLRGKDPQSEQEIDQMGCAIAWQPILAIENSQQTRHAAAAIESFRNEMVKQNNVLLGSIPSRPRLAGGN